MKILAAGNYVFRSVFHFSFISIFALLVFALAWWETHNNISLLMKIIGWFLLDSE